MNVVGMEIETGNPQPDQEDDEMNEDEDDTEVDIDAEQMTDEELDLLEVIHLEELLKLALAEEKYELAVRIRDAIKRRKNASPEA